MSSVQHLREFISQRLTAAAEEIFSEFEKTIVQYEEEIGRQRRLLDISWKPQINFHRVELPQYYLCEEEIPVNLEKDSSLDQEEPEPPQIKEEPVEVCTSHEEQQLLLKQENDNPTVTLTYEESDRSEAEPTNVQLQDQSQDQEGSGRESTGNAELRPKKRRHSNDGDNSSMSESHRNTAKGVSQDLYRQMQRSNVQRTCAPCRDTNATDRSSVIEDQPPASMPSPVPSRTGNNESIEESLQETVVEDTVLDDHPVAPTYEVVECGTKRGRPQLIDNSGYRFGVHHTRSSSVTWRCTARPNGAACRAKVLQRDGVFEAGQYPHNHGPNPGAATAAKVAARVKAEATRDLFKSAAVIVQEVLLDEVQEGVHCPALSKPLNLARAANRRRQRTRPCEPKDLNFVVSMDHVPPSFLRGDVRVSDDVE
ncbi:uncharacterized protein PAE49_003226 isoform 3-T3 [Odontesthes bonariensis]|uniref:uncharacterized protein LOC142382438 isoform X3 n=1 Tax=Odontesthes bonariensis TaxID=219752 RepID=UPI003F58B259